MQEILPVAAGKAPKLALWVEEEDTVLPDKTRRHNGTDTFTATSRSHKQDVFDAIMEHELMCEWIDTDDNAAIFDDFLLLLPCPNWMTEERKGRYFLIRIDATVLGCIQTEV